MSKLLKKLRNLIPKTWQQKIVFVVAFVILLIIELKGLLFKKLAGLTPSTNRQKFIFTVAAVFLLLTIAPVLYWLVKSTGQPRPDEPEVITYSTTTPGENNPEDNYNWRGGAQDPKKIIIPSLGIDGYIQKVGVDQNREIAVPNNIHLAGWFVDSVRPGEKGLSIIDGHVDGRQNDGVFKQLPNIEKDAEVIVEFGDNRTEKFRVIDKVSVPAGEAPSLLFSQNPRVSSQLNLITCVGSFDAGTRRYQDRVIVSTELIH